MTWVAPRKPCASRTMPRVCNGGAARGSRRPLPWEDGGMDLAQFVDSHRPKWEKLSVLLDRIEAGGLAQLSLEEAQQFGNLYRQASNDLLTARGRAASAELVEYLNE